MIEQSNTSKRNQEEEGQMKVKGNLYKGMKPELNGYKKKQLDGLRLGRRRRAEKGILVNDGERSVAPVNLVYAHAILPQPWLYIQQFLLCPYIFF